MWSKKARIITALVSSLFIAGCAYTSSFSLPVHEADIDAGRQAFIDHRCHQCHSVAGIRLPPLAGASTPQLELGGRTHTVKNHAELLTSIINPNHAISEDYRQKLLLEGEIPLDSPMPTPRIDNMTVRQLIDLVAFLDSRYVLIDGYDPGS